MGRIPRGIWGKFRRKFAANSEENLGQIRGGGFGANPERYFGANSKGNWGNFRGELGETSEGNLEKIPREIWGKFREKFRANS